MNNAFWRLRKEGRPVVTHLKVFAERETGVDHEKP